MCNQSNNIDHVKLVTKAISNTVTIQQYNYNCVKQGTETFKTKSYGKLRSTAYKRFLK